MKSSKILFFCLMTLLTILLLAKVELYLSFDFIKSHVEVFQKYQQENRFLSRIGFFVIYILACTASLPSSAILSLLAGALFGFVEGTILASFANAIGASLALLVSRYFFHNSVQKKFGSRLKEVNRGLEKDGGFYILLIRMTPVIPFFVTNLLMGLTKIRLKTFYIFTQLGMLPVTMVFANAGRALADIKSPEDILSWELMLSLSLLGVLPLFLKWLVKRFKLG